MNLRALSGQIKALCRSRYIQGYTLPNIDGEMRDRIFRNINQNVSHVNSIVQSQTGKLDLKLFKQILQPNNFHKKQKNFPKMWACMPRKVKTIKCVLFKRLLPIRSGGSSEVVMFCPFPRCPFRILN